MTARVSRWSLRHPRGQGLAARPATGCDLSDAEAAQRRPLAQPGSRRNAPSRRPAARLLDAEHDLVPLQPPPSSEQRLAEARHRPNAGPRPPRRPARRPGLRQQRPRLHPAPDAVAGARRKPVDATHVAGRSFHLPPQLPDSQLAATTSPAAQPCQPAGPSIQTSLGIAPRQRRDAGRDHSSASRPTKSRSLTDRTHRLVAFQRRRRSQVPQFEPVGGSDHDRHQTSRRRR